MASLRPGEGGGQGGGGGQQQQPALAPGLQRRQIRDR
jgi:hypothetical protein